MNKLINYLKKIKYISLNKSEYVKAVNCMEMLSKKKEECVFILTCGPSLELFIDNYELRQILKSSFCISIKQAFEHFPEETDLHVVNEIRHKKYDYGQNKPLVISTGALSSNIVKDAHLPIIDYRYSTSTFVTNNYEKARLNAQNIFRPWGIGVMYEVGLFLPELLNAKKVIIIGFDMNRDGRYHFYDNSHSHDSASYQVDEDEFYYNQRTIPHYEKWMADKGIAVALLSPESALPFNKKLVDIDDLKSFMMI